MNQSHNMVEYSVVQLIACNPIAIVLRNQFNYHKIFEIVENNRIENKLVYHTY